MNMNTLRTYGILLLFAFGALAFSCSDGSVDAWDEARITFEEEASKISSAQSWDLVLKDAFNDNWRLSKYQTIGDVSFLKGEYDYLGKTRYVAAQYNTSTKIMSLAVLLIDELYGERAMLEVVKYYGNNRFNGYYNFNNKTLTGADRLTILENNSDITFGIEALSESDIDSELPQMDTIREPVDEGIVL